MSEQRQTKKEDAEREKEKRPRRHEIKSGGTGTFGAGSQNPHPLLPESWKFSSGSGVWRQKARGGNATLPLFRAERQDGGKPESDGFRRLAPSLVLAVHRPK